MDYEIENQLKIISNNLNNETITEALSALETVYDYLITENDENKISMIISVICEGKNNLLNLIKNIQDEKKHPVFNKAIQRIFDIFHHIVLYFSELPQEFVILILNACTENISISPNSVVKEHSYDIMMHIIRKSTVFFNDQSFESVLNEFYNSSRTAKEYMKKCQLIRTVVQLYPEKIADKIPQLFRYIRREINLEIRRSSHKLEVLLECLSSILNKFSDKLIEWKKKIYDIIKNIIDDLFKSEFIRKDVEIAFNLFHQHLPFVVEYVYEEYNWWFRKLHDYLCFRKEDVAVELFELYYIEMANMLKKKLSCNDKIILQFFIEKLQNYLKSDDNLQIIIAVKGLSNFTEVCKFYRELEEINMFLKLVVQIFEKHCSSFENQFIQFHYVADILLSSAKIVKCLNYDSLQNDDLDTLMKITLSVITLYPKLGTNHQNKTHEALVETIINVAMIDSFFLDLYLENVFYSALIKCCSYLTKCDAQFLKESVTAELTNCGQFIELWIYLCNIENNGKNFDGEKLSLLHKEKLGIKIYDVFIKSSLKIIEKLVSVNQLGIEAETNINIFVNLVEIFSEVVLQSAPEKLAKWTDLLIINFINYSRHHLFKSGFYELLTVIFKQSFINTYAELDELTKNKLQGFLLNEIQQLHKVKENDTVKFLRMIMNSPPVVVPYIVPVVVPVFQMLFNIGLKDIALASDGLIILQRWYFSLPLNEFKPTLSLIISSLVPFLQSKKLVKSSQHVTEFDGKEITAKTSRKRKKDYQKYREIRISSKCDSKLSKLQKEIIKFIGQIDEEFILDVSAYSSKDFAIGRFSESLKFNVPYKDMKIKIFLDKFLPRIIELACDNEDASVRIIACEVLHSIVIIFIGNTRDNICPKHAKNTFKILISSVFKLATDINTIVKQLFHPLSFQITRYYSHKIQFKGVITNLFDCVCSDSDIALRNFSVELIEEFFKWSVKENFSEIHHCTNILAVIKRICLLCLKPYSYKRLGAALAFNCISKYIRENESLLSIFWIDLFFYFIKNISLSSDKDCNNEETAVAITTINQVLCEKYDIFKKTDGRRKIPQCLNNGTLHDIVDWLFPHCLSHNKYSRNLCMKFIKELIRNSGDMSFHNYESTIINSALKFNDTYLNDEFVIYSQNIIIYEENLELFKRVIKWLQSFSSFLHFHFWLLKEKVHSVDLLNFENDRTGLLKSVKFYCEYILTNNLSNVLQFVIKKSVYANDVGIFIDSVENTFLQLLEMLTVVDNQIKFFIGDKLWQTNLLENFILCLFEFSLFETRIFSDEYLEIFTKDIKQFTTVLPNLIPRIQYNEFHRTFLQLFEDTLTKHDSTSLIKHKYYLELLNVLEMSNIMYSNILKVINKDRKDVIQIIYRNCNQNVPSIISYSPSFSFVENYLSFLLQTDVEVKWLLSLIFDSSNLKLGNSNVNISCGEHFFNTFKIPIIKFLHRFQEPLTTACFSNIQSINTLKMRIILNCLQFNVSQHPFKYLTAEIIENWRTLSQWSEITPNSIVYLYDIIKTLLDRNEKLENIKDDDIFVIFSWIIKHMYNDEKFLNLLPFCLQGNTNENINNKLRKSLNDFKDHLISLPSNSQLNKEKDLRQMLLNKVSFVLCKTKNPVIFEFVISIIATDISYMKINSIHRMIDSIMIGTDDNVQLQLLNTAFQLSQKNQSFNFRINCIEIFVLPLLYSAVPAVSKQFFSDHRDLICDYISKASGKFNTVDLEKQVFERGIMAILLLCTYYETVRSFDCTDELFDNRSISKISILIVRKNPEEVKNINKELSKLLKRYAFNLLLSIIKTNKDSKFYIWLFKCDKNKSYIWENIVNIEEEIKLKNTPNKISARKKIIIQKRKELNKNSANYLIPTEYLSASSLVDDVVKYDMTGWNISENQFVYNVGSYSSKVELEEDELNNHECMQSLCDFIRFSVAENIFDVSSKEPFEWMNELKSSLERYIQAGRKYLNIIIFILKFIHNCQDIFFLFPNHWFNVIIESLVFLKDTNYFFSDITIMLLSWNSDIVIVNESLMSDFFILLISQINYKENVVRSGQFQLIKAVIEVWYRFITPPSDRLLTMISSNLVDIELSLEISKFFLIKQVIPFIEADRHKYMEFVLKCISDKPNHIRILSFEVFALILRNVKKANGMLLDVDERMQRNLIDKLNELKLDNTKMKFNHFLSCLHHVLMYYPDILHNFVPYLLNNFKKYFGEFKIKCLKILSLDSSQLRDDIFTELLKQQFDYCLSNKNDSDYELVENSLNFIKLMLNKIDDFTIEKLLPNIVKLSTHDVPIVRNFVYDIVDFIYSKYRFNNENQFMKICMQCKVILLNALYDTDTTLQNKMFSNWFDRFYTPESTSEQFLNIFKEMYSSYNESLFPCYLIDILFEVCTKTPDYESRIFNNPLSNCLYENYEIKSSLCSTSITSNRFSFIGKSVSSQLSELFSQNSSFTLSGKTQKSLIFKPIEDPNPYESCRKHFYKAVKESEHSSLLYKLRNRFHSDTSKASKYYKYKNYVKKLKEENSDKSQQLRINRKYRIGDFPDIEISYKDIIMPLKLLAKNDAIIGKEIFISLFKGMINEISSKKNYLKNFNRIINEHLNCTWQHDSIFLQMLFNIAFTYLEDIDLDPEKIVLFSQSNKLPTVGALLLENSIMNKLIDDLSFKPKKPRINQTSADYLWIQLANVYKSLDEFDVVNGILKEKIKNDCYNVLKKGIEYEQSNKWLDALNVYESEVKKNLSDKSNTDSYYENIVVEAFFKCSAYLCEWKKIKEHVETKFQDLNSLWNNNWHVENTLWWYLLSKCHGAVRIASSENNYDGSVIDLSLKNTIESWLKEEDKKSILHNVMTEPLAIMFLMWGHRNRAHVIISDNIKLILNEWNQTNISTDKLLKLQMLSEIENMIAVFQSSDKLPASSVENILLMWDQNAPQVNHLSWWDRRITYRDYFIGKYQKVIEEDSAVRKSLKNYKINSYFQMAKNALYRKNFKFAANYFSEYYKFIKTENSPVLNSDACILHSKILLQSALQINEDCVSKEVKENKTKKLMQSVEALKNFSTDSNICQFKYITYYNDLLSKIILELSIDSFISVNQLVKIVNNIPDRDYSNKEDLISVLDRCILENYRKAITLAENHKYSDSIISSVCLNIVKYCQKSKTEGLANNELIMRYILKAIKFNSKHACLLFPTTLIILHKNIEEDRITKIFIDECDQIEEWKFLTWIHQLFAYINTDLVKIIRKLIIRITKAYPKATIYPFLICQELCFNTAKKSVLNELEDVLCQEQNMFDFVKALSFVCVPDIVVQYYMRKLLDNFKENNVQTILDDCEKLNSTLCSPNSVFRGKIFDDNSNWKNLKHAIGMARSSIQKNDTQQVKNLLSGYIDEFKKTSDKNSLKSYCPWFSKYSHKIEDIEIPGQYGKFSIPLPDYHIKIFAFCEKIMVMTSKQKPIKLTIIGDDAKKYPYLIKFGDDLRQDQRIQQLFLIMNQFFSEETEKYVNKSHLIIYDVIPLKLNLGLIQWMKNTSTLKNFMFYGLTDEQKIKEKKKLESVRVKYRAQLCGTNLNQVFSVKIYEQAVYSYSRLSTATKFQKLYEEIPGDIFKRSLLNLSASPNVFWNLRNDFMISYSTMSVCSWILGIGDRHMNNILVCLQTGKCFGIDFGIAFGAGTECLQIPELIPFRLTPHIRSIMDPFNLTGLIRESMVNVLNVIKKNELTLLSDLQIFVVEPSLDWLNAAKRHEQEKSDEFQISEFKWYPDIKIQIIKQKLNGGNPCKIITQEIKNNQRITEVYRLACIKLLQDSCEKGLPEDNLKTVEQINCLLDLATDNCILGTSWEGLETWI